MNGNHYTVLILMLVAIFTQTAGLDHWGDALHPPFLSGTALAVLAILRAMYVDRPGGRGDLWTDEERDAHREAEALPPAPPPMVPR